MVRELNDVVFVSAVRTPMGRFGDPRVGRDVLIGAVAGVVVILIQRLEWLVPSWLGSAPRITRHSEIRAFAASTSTGSLRASENSSIASSNRPKPQVQRLAV